MTFPLLVSVRPGAGINIRDGVWGRIVGVTDGRQSYRVEGYELSNGELWLKIWWDVGKVAYIAGWLCPLSMLAPLEG